MKLTWTQRALAQFYNWGKPFAWPNRDLLSADSIDDLPGVNRAQVRKLAVILRDTLEELENPVDVVRCKVGEVVDPRDEICQFAGGMAVIR